MNGFVDHQLSEEDFGASKGGLKSFDAFPKTKATYLTRSKNGGMWTVALAVISIYLFVTELSRWFGGTTTHTFHVEKGVGHDLQMNMDIVVAMPCSDLRINVQDAAGDRILASEKLKMDPTNFKQWGKGKNIHSFDSIDEEYARWKEEEDVHDFLGAKRGKKFKKTPRIRGLYNACRIFGSLEGNKVMGDFHITARGHGYMEMGEHLDHGTFNFSHHVNELSFGPYYPSLHNPLDGAVATTDEHFFKFQYYLSLVPTVYTTDPEILASLSSTAPSVSNPLFYSSNTVWTNQYAVTEQSHRISEYAVPGIFFKYDIEPILLTISEESGGFLALLIRLINVLSGVLIAGEWFYRLSDWGMEVWGRRRKRNESMGVLTGRRSGDYSEKRYD